MSARLVIVVVVGALAAWTPGCSNEGPQILEARVVSDTDLTSGPYEVRVVAYDPDGLGEMKLDVAASNGSREEPPLVLDEADGARRRAAPGDARDVDGARLVAHIHGQPLGTLVRWRAVVCDAAGACTRADAQQFLVGKEPSRPRVTSVSPTSGPESGGTRVEVRGEDLRPGVHVRFGRTDAAHTEWLRSDLVLATTPPHAPGLVDVRVENVDGPVARLAEAFEFLPSPLVTRIDPTSGPTSGGTLVTIRGQRFFEGVRALFDSAPCRSLVRASESELRCETPPGAAGPADVEVVHETRGRSLLAGAFTYVAAPLVDGVDPETGPDIGGTTITVRGDGFVDGATVTIDGAPCVDVTITAPDELTCTTPPGDAGVADIVVTNPDGQQGELRGGFDYEGPPVVLVVSPAEAPIAGGVEVRVLGAGFRDNDVVRFGDVEVEIVERVGDAEVIVRAPPVPGDVAPAPDSGQRAVDVSVQRVDPLDDRSGTLTAGFVYFWPPEVTSVAPPSGPTVGGTDVIVNGRFFREVLGEDLVVRFDDLECAASVRISSTQIACTTPPGDPGFADVSVENHPLSLGIGADAFFYVAPPEVIAVDPDQGPTFGGDLVVVTGRFFQDGALVFIDGAPCNGVVFVSETELTCIAPSGEEGFADVRVVNPDAQEDTAPQLYEYVGVSVTPDHGLPVGFTRVRVRAAGIQPGALVTFGVEIAECTFVSSFELSCQTPSHALGPVEVSFFNPDGTGDSREGAFTYRRLRNRTQESLTAPDSNCTHVEVVDTDLDGDLDIVASMGRVNIEEQSLLFENDGAAVFEPRELLEATANKVSVGDVNVDGRPDLLFAVSGGGARLLRNDGEGAFDEVDLGDGLLRGAFDAMLEDFVGDQRDDIYVLTIGCDQVLDASMIEDCDPLLFGRDVLLEAESGGGFVNRSDLAPHIEEWTHDHKFVASDLDIDGDQDLVVIVNDDPYFSAQNRILRNRIDEGQGFVAETPESLLALVGDLYDIDAGDLDGDGDEDVVTSICAQPNGETGEVILVNDGGQLTRDTAALPSATEDCDVGVLAHDIDDDGDLDVFFGGTRDFDRYSLKLYVNRGDGTFVDATGTLPDLAQRRLQVNNLAGGDLDRDGDQDIVIAGGAPYSDPGRRGDVLVFLLD